MHRWSRIEFVEDLDLGEERVEETVATMLFLTDAVFNDCFKLYFYCNKEVF